MILSVQPRSVDVTHDGVVVEWDDGHLSRFSLLELRMGCSCAQCRELRARDEAVWTAGDDHAAPEVKDADLVGAWGLSLRWDDGHDTGVYTWEVLRERCACSLCSRT